MSELDILYDEDFISNLPNFIRGRYNPFVVAIFKSPNHDMRKIAEQIEAWYKELPVNFRKNFYNLKLLVTEYFLEKKGFLQESVIQGIKHPIFPL